MGLNSLPNLACTRINKGGGGGFEVQGHHFTLPLVVLTGDLSPCGTLLYTPRHEMVLACVYNALRPPCRGTERASWVASTYAQSLGAKLGPYNQSIYRRISRTSL